jgi:hypothetical protein
MKKIGIITIFKANNYGAELQAFALQRKLQLMGHDVELIDYPFYKHKSHRRSRLSAPIFDIGRMNRVKETVFPAWQHIIGLRHRRALLTRAARMDDFHKKYTCLSERTYCTLDALVASPPDCNVYMVGSDQVWNPRMYTSIAPYFLDFAPAGKRRVAYAPSFGVSSLPASVQDYYAKQLNTFDALSVREQQGSTIIRELTGRQVEQVLDPTLLLDAKMWSTVARAPESSEPYVLVYELMSSSTALAVARRVAKRLKIPRVLRVCGTQHSRREEGIEDIRDAGPAEFVGLFSHAAFVITNSFHGTAFAINYQIPFYAIIPGRMKNAGRIGSLLELTGLNGRLLAEDQAPHHPIDADVDFTFAQAELAHSVQASLAYLARSVTG